MSKTQPQTSENEEEDAEFVCEKCGSEFVHKNLFARHKSVIHDGSRLGDPEELQRLYWKEGLSLREISDELEATLDKVTHRFDLYDIETRTANRDLGYVSYRIDKDAYHLWRHYVDGNYYRVLVHRLLAVSEYGFDAVVGNDVHHKNGIRWDNRPDNIEVIDPVEHRRKHGLENAEQQRELMKRLHEEGKICD